MKIVYYTSGITGSGRIVRGIAIGNAFKRKSLKVDYTILSSSKFALLAEEFHHVEIPLEELEKLSQTNYKSSILYRTLLEQKPDVLLVDLLWFPLYHFIDELNCKKIFLCRQIDDRFFSISMSDEKLIFRKKDYDLIFAIEPFRSSIEMDSINPLIMRNRDEIFSRNLALKKLCLYEGTKICFLAYNGHPGDYEKVKKTYRYLEDEGFQMVYTTNYKGGIFPILDYFNACDLLICGAGYNAFWEAIYFKKETIFVPTTARFENGKRRIEECQYYSFDENGSDQLVDIIMKL